MFYVLNQEESERLVFLCVIMRKRKRLIEQLISSVDGLHLEKIF